MTTTKHLARATAGMTAALCLASGLNTATAHASTNPTWGRACMFNKSKDVALGNGHVAWGIKVRGDKDHWIYGSTDGARNVTGFAWAGRYNGSWIKSGTWLQTYRAFAKRGYDRYRCVNTRDGDARAAQAMYRTQAANGFIAPGNDCLTKALDIIKSYSRILGRDPRLPDPILRTQQPNFYFLVILPADHWEGRRPLL
jgi:hypothetical protein